MPGTSVKIDAMSTLAHNFINESVGNTAGQRTFCRARERPIQISPIREITHMVEKPININNRNCNQGSANATQRPMLQYPTYYLHAIDLIPVYRRAYEKSRSRTITPDNL